MSTTAGTVDESPGGRVVMNKTDRQAVHAALTWATRRGGWYRGVTRHAYSTLYMDLVWWELPHDGDTGGALVADLENPPFRMSFAPESVRQALDVLVALSLLPPHFSSAYAVGRARGTVDGWRREASCAS